MGPDFIQSLSVFIAAHTEQSSVYIEHLISSFMQGASGRFDLEASAREELTRRLKADMEAHNNVPSFLHYYLLQNLKRDQWAAQAAFIASRYMARQSAQRYMSWAERRQQVAHLDEEQVRGTELGHRQFLYSQGAEAVFRWRGVPCFKAVYDLAIYAMLIDELRPGSIIELGSGGGGSALLLADLCTSSGLTTQIMSIDRTAVAGISDPRISFVQSDCVEWLAAAARAKRDFPRPCLLIEDFHGDLAVFFSFVDAILTGGDYLVIEDSNPKQSRIAQLMAGRPYLIDSKYTDFFGINCTSAINSIFVKGAAGRVSQ